MDAGFPVYLGFFACGFAVRLTYERLKLTGRVDSQRPMVFITVFAGMCLLWMGWFSMVPADPVKVSLPRLLRVMGVGITGVGLVLALGAFVQLRGLENIDHLVTTGLFSRIRHPMYAGFLCWILGWILAHGAILSLIPALVGVAGILHWQRLEEAALNRRFGLAYRAYRSKTWF